MRNLLECGRVDDHHSYQGEGDLPLPGEVHDRLSFSRAGNSGVPGEGEFHRRQLLIRDAQCPSFQKGVESLIHKVQARGFQIDFLEVTNGSVNILGLVGQDSLSDR